MKFPPNLICTRTPSPLGTIILAASASGLAGLWFDGQQHQPDAGAWTRDDKHALLREACAQLGQWFDGRRKAFDLPLDLQAGTAFQQSVWQALLQIPCGATTSYGQVSARIGRPSAVRAVGAAIGRNPLCVIVPCHRVVGANGSLTGYAGGLQRKTALLQLESRT
jgi:methylated-DNA-[protein]-cysteine S-methyltransferase